MARTQLFANPYITVEYDADNQLIVHTVHQPIEKGQMESFKQALNLGTEALAQHGLSKWLSDDRKNGPLIPEMVEWATTDWNPRTIQAGWRYWANVVPEEVHSAGSLTPLIDALFEHGLQMQVFKTVEDALAWLRSVE